MANGTRTSTRFLVFIIGAAIGWFVGCGKPAAPPPPPTPVPTMPVPTVVPTPVAGNHLIEVGPAAKDVSEDDAAISKKLDHKVIWIPKDEKMKLQIVFRASDFPTDAGGEPPFEGGRKNTDFQVRCRDGVCKSGHINQNLQPEGKKLYYKSTQILIAPNGKKDEADAGIIIQP